MDASQTALESLRTVEFRETLKGYHRDDVDEYLEKAAVEAEGLQEQLRQANERLRQAAETISRLEGELEAARAVPPPPPAPAPAEAAVADDTLQRTLLLAQKFVDETKADSEAQAARIIADADAKARLLAEQAEAKVNRLQAESEQLLRDEIARLEGTRTRLSTEVEAMSRHLESERLRLRSALADILTWVDENVHPGGAVEPEGGATSVARLADAPRPSGQAGGEVTQLRPGGVGSRPPTNASLPL